jgi:metallo-beta-lactamase class B
MRSAVRAVSASPRWFILGGVLAALLVTGAACAAPPLIPDAPKPCEACEAWNRRLPPFRVFGNTYYVGVAGLSALLIASDAGHILLDGDLPQSAPLIAENIRALGFRLEDVRLIVNSHAHFDHAGGIAALQRASGAVVAASPAGARALESGEPVPEDPQYGFGRESNGFPPVPAVRTVADGETLRIGELAITAHFTPGHTPGSTTWTWRACEAARCLDVVYADSLNAVSAPGFRYTQSPGLVDGFRRSIAAVAQLPCDILLSVHPGFSDLEEKLRRRAAGTSGNPFVDRRACRAYAAVAARTLDRRIATEAQ